MAKYMLSGYSSFLIFYVSLPNFLPKHPLQICREFRLSGIVSNALHSVWTEKTADSNAPTCYLSVFSCNYDRFWIYLPHKYYTNLIHGQDHP